MWKYERLKIDWDTGINSVTGLLDKPSLEFIPTAVKKTELKILAKKWEDLDDGEVNWWVESAVSRSFVWKGESVGWCFKKD